MEWLGVLLLYLISGLYEKRQQNKNRKIIESDPDWDNEDYLESEETSNNFEQLLNDLFEQIQNSGFKFCYKRFIGIRK